MLGVNGEGGREIRSGMEDLIRRMKVFWFSFQASWSGGKGKINDGGRKMMEEGK